MVKKKKKRKNNAKNLPVWYFYIQTLSLDAVEKETIKNIHNEVRCLSTVLQYLQKVEFPYSFVRGCFSKVTKAS